MSEIFTHEMIAGYGAPVHRALTEPILLAGAPRAVAILNGTRPRIVPQVFVEKADSRMNLAGQGRLCRSSERHDRSTPIS